MSRYRQELGQRGEALAEEYLTSRRYCVIDRHWHGRYGEIDLVASDPEAKTLVFVEVKTRTSETFGRIDETIDRRKLEKLNMAIDRYVSEHRYRGPYRLDAILIKFGRRPTIQHIKNISID
ncbi:MAG: YraN family protein [Patescibacteria group bacterium]